ncbi:uncharacterized protein [Arachis hypogaea]|uniref:uncharacterized protein n=1 Tax=Arachis hypogaea TaxID=3818 RepID=UPI0007AF9F0A
MANELYKKGIDGSLSRCLGQNDQNITSGKVHNGICGAHQAGKKMRWVLYRNHRIKNFVASRNINMVTSTPYYAQANGQVEAANKILIMLPLEINLNTLRISKQSDLPVDDYWNAMFNELSELDSERLLALDNMIRQKAGIARSYNCRIKEKSFNTGELVLKVILPMEKKSKFLGKWSHIWEGPFQVIARNIFGKYLSD